MSTNPLDGPTSDGGMVKVMAMVLAALTLFALFLIAMARLLDPGDDQPDDPVLRQALVSRLEPIGRVRTSAEDLEQVAMAGTGAASGERTGEELVQGVCAGCHVSGAGGAPLLDDAEAWAERREAGLDALVASVINGKGSMPARGGSDYTDEEIRLAVQHIAMFEPEDGADAAASAGEGAEAEAMTAGEATGGAEEAAAGDDVTTVADTEGVVTKRDVGDAGGPGEVVEEAIAEGVGAEQGEDAPLELAALVASGEEPAGMPESVKTAVDGVCVGCHIAGVANAPKIGDKEAWQARAEQGLAALTQTVIDGKGAMPARGGSNLSDEEIAVAVQYLMSKQQ